MNYQTTGKFICEQRKKKGLTQLKLAEKLNVSEKTVQNGNVEMVFQTLQL